MTSRSSKRSYIDFAAGSEPTLTLITADGGRIPAHSEVLRLVCSCLRNAPARDIWDLSSLLLNQQTVTAVLEAVYSSLHALDFDLRPTAGQYSMQELLDMLLFAESVSCSRGIITEIVGLLTHGCVRRELEVVLPVGAGRSSSAGRTTSTAAAAAAAAATVPPAAAPGAGPAPANSLALHLDATYSVVIAYEDVAEANPPSSSMERIGLLTRWWEEDSKVVRIPNERQQQQLHDQLTQQLEALLFVGFKLDLQQLLQPALRFMRNHGPELLGTAEVDKPGGGVFSPRVLAAAGGASGAELLSRSCWQEPLGAGFGIGTVFADVKFMDVHQWETLSRVCFTGKLLRPLLSFPTSTTLRVDFCAGGKCTMWVDTLDYNEDSPASVTFGVVLGSSQTFKEAYDNSSDAARM